MQQATRNRGRVVWAGAELPDVGKYPLSGELNSLENACNNHGISEVGSQNSSQ